jgi:hypothetical protein
MYRISRLIQFLALWIIVLSNLSVVGQSFTQETYNVGVDLNVAPSVFGNGVSVYDFNQDGWDDLSFCNNGDTAQFYLNNNGNFELVELTSNYLINGDSKQILWVDYDNDGDKDIYIANYSDRIVLLRNDGNLTFTDVSIAAGLYDQDLMHYGSAWGDVDNDGYLDLYVCKYHNPDISSGFEYMNNIYRNNGDGTFTELSQGAGTSNGIAASFQAIFFDYDSDGFQDIYIINDRFQDSNTMYRNNGDWTFTDVSSDIGLDLQIDAMCIAPGDFDGDGDMDMYITDSYSNHLMENQNGFYVNVASDYGVLGDGTSWGSLWIDHDLDMDLDLFVANTNNVITIELQNSFYENLGLFFLEDYEEFGLEEDVHGTYSVAMGDFNNDGHPDFAEGNNSPSDCHVYFNEGSTGKHWVKISLEGVISNRDGIGSWIRVFSGGTEQVQYTFAGENYLSQNSQHKLFGLGNNTVIDSVQIDWLSGIQNTLYNLPVDSNYHFIEGFDNQNFIALPTGNFACYGDSVLLNAGNYESYLWNTGATSQTIYAIEDGEYTVTVEHENGLSSSSDSVFIDIGPMLEYDLISNDVDCFGDSTGWANLTFSEELDVYNVMWNEEDWSFTEDSLAAGTYQLEVQFLDVCIDSLEVVINESDSIYFVAYASDVLCHGDSTGTVEFEISGGNTPYTIGIDEVSAMNLLAGEYEVEVVDSLGCSTNVIFAVNQPDELTSTITVTDITDNSEGGAELEIMGGTEPYLIEWSTGDSLLGISPLPVGDYWVDITDENGCETSHVFIVTYQQDFPDRAQFAAVFPNPFNEQLTITLDSFAVSRVNIMSSTGQLLDSIELLQKNNHISTLEWSKGLYILEVVQGNSKQHMKIIKY